MNMFITMFLKLLGRKCNICLLKAQENGSGNSALKRTVFIVSVIRKSSNSRHNLNWHYVVCISRRHHLWSLHALDVYHHRYLIFEFHQIEPKIYNCVNDLIVVILTCSLTDPKKLRFCWFHKGSCYFVWRKKWNTGMKNYVRIFSSKALQHIFTKEGTLVMSYVLEIYISDKFSFYKV